MEVQITGYYTSPNDLTIMICHQFRWYKQSIWQPFVPAVTIKQSKCHYIVHSIVHILSISCHPYMKPAQGLWLPFLSFGHQIMTNWPAVPMCSKIAVYWYALCRHAIAGDFCAVFQAGLLCPWWDGVQQGSTLSQRLSILPCWPFMEWLRIIS